jgi:hypothetical protein
MQALILGSGVVVLLTLAWVHLGLGAALVAPAATPPRMAASAGAYTVTMYANSGQFVAGDGNVVEFDLRNHDGQPVTNATVRVHADMMTMAMPVPDASAVAQTGGKYHARLVFSMAGPWRLTVIIATPAHADVQVAFDVGVRWR